MRVLLSEFQESPFERFRARAKLVTLAILFISPLAAAEWNAELDAWMQQSHYLEPLPVPQVYRESEEADEIDHEPEDESQATELTVAISE